MKEKLDILLTSASGIEKVLKSELVRMGYPEPPAVNGELETVDPDNFVRVFENYMKFEAE